MNNNINPTQNNNNSSLSIAGFVCSLCGFITCGLTSIVGLVLSIIGLQESKKKGQPYGMAIAGIAISSILLIFILMMLIAGAGSNTNTESNSSKTESSKTQTNDKQKTDQNNNKNSTINKSNENENKPIRKTLLRSKTTISHNPVLGEVHPEKSTKKMPLRKMKTTVSQTTKVTPKKDSNNPFKDTDLSIVSND